MLSLYSEICGAGWATVSRPAENGARVPSGNPSQCSIGALDASKWQSTTETCLQLDNGMRRVDSVRDIGALLDWTAEQPELDGERVAVYGGSYGGYMVLASSVH